MSDFTEEDREYRNDAIRTAFRVGRAMRDNPEATVKRYVITGGQPELGIPGSTAPAPGFPVTIPVNYKAVVGTELQDLAGLDVAEAVQMTAFDFEFESDDIVELYGEEYRIFSHEYDRGTEVNRLVLVPWMSTNG